MLFRRSLVQSIFSRYIFVNVETFLFLKLNFFSELPQNSQLCQKFLCKNISDLLFLYNTPSNKRDNGTLSIFYLVKLLGRKHL